MTHPDEIMKQMKAENAFVENFVMKREKETGEQIPNISIEEDDDGNLYDTITGEFVLI